MKRENPNFELTSFASTYPRTASIEQKVKKRRKQEKKRERKRETRDKKWKKKRIKTKAWTDGGVMLFRCWELGGATSGTPKEDSSESAGLVATVASLPPAPSSNFRWLPPIPLQGFTKPSKLEEKLHHLLSSASRFFHLFSISSVCFYFFSSPFSRIYLVRRHFDSSRGLFRWKIVNRKITESAEIRPQVGLALIAGFVESRLSK